MEKKLKQSKKKNNDVLFLPTELPTAFIPTVYYIEYCCLLCAFGPIYTTLWPFS
jgi:hypothetical protein